MASLLPEERLQASMVMHMMCEEDLQVALEHEDTMVGSDGLPPGFDGKPHPRMYSTFSPVLAQYVRQERRLSLEEAVCRMTSLAAEWFGPRHRGVVAAGMSADLVCPDAETVSDRATYE